MSTALVVSLNQAAIDGIRAAGAKQVINVEGNGKWCIDLSLLHNSWQGENYTDLLSTAADSSQPGQVPGPGRRPRALTARPTRKLSWPCIVLYLTNCVVAT
jgi:hypothetical protein